MVVSGGHTDHVEESQDNDPDYLPGSHELVSQMSVGKLGASEMQISRGNEETHAQPRIQSNSVSDPSKEFIPIEERK